MHMIIDHTEINLSIVRSGVFIAFPIYKLGLAHNFVHVTGLLIRINNDLSFVITNNMSIPDFMTNS